MKVQHCKRKEGSPFGECGSILARTTQTGYTERYSINSLVFRYQKLSCRVHGMHSFEQQSAKSPSYPINNQYISVCGCVCVCTCVYIYICYYKCIYVFKHLSYGYKPGYKAIMIVYVCFVLSQMTLSISSLPNMQASGAPSLPAPVPTPEVLPTAG